ncbi:MAG: glycoside hydrolase [Gammaproteobacteria bacterium]
MSDNRLRLVLCWHMHQPEYRDLQTGEYQLPWTYLHVIKDYIDMVSHLETFPSAKAVVNFAPILLEQIEDYAKQVNDFLHENKALRDPFLAALAAPDITSNHVEQLQLIRDCLRLNRERQVDRYPLFQKLVAMAEWIEHHHLAFSYLNSQFIFDLLVWYHLAWMAESVKLTDERIKGLIEKGSNYTLRERREIVEIIGELLSGVLHRYHALNRLGRIELSVTPWAHPIMPLLLDIKSAYQAMPDADMPELDSYPGGEERVHWHIERGLETFERFFGFRPWGCWPSEGSVSTETLELLSEHHFGWAATGGSVLRNSLGQSGLEGESPHHPFRVEGAAIPCFFRDDGLSDLIGFEYSKWHADDAVADLIEHLERIRKLDDSTDKVVSIIMDGENAWEYFPNNGYHFLSALYSKLTQHPNIRLTTFSECLNEHINVKTLPQMTAGSWVYGTFSTWIGDTDKNRGWDMLGDVKRCFDKITAEGRLNDDQLREAERQLAVCEGSDWFWWFGDYNPGDAVSSFEKQFRLNLTNLYKLMGEEPPSYLALSFTQGSGSPEMGGTMRHGVE